MIHVFYHNNKASVSGAPRVALLLGWQQLAPPGCPYPPAPSTGLALVTSFRAYVHIFLLSVHLCPVMRPLPGGASPVEKPPSCPAPPGPLRTLNTALVA